MSGKRTSVHAGTSSAPLLPFSGKGLAPPHAGQNPPKTTDSGPLGRSLRQALSSILRRLPLDQEVASEALEDLAENLT